MLLLITTDFSQWIKKLPIQGFSELPILPAQLTSSCWAKARKNTNLNCLQLKLGQLNNKPGN